MKRRMSWCLVLMAALVPLFFMGCSDDDDDGPCEAMVPAEFVLEQDGVTSRIALDLEARPDGMLVPMDFSQEDAVGAAGKSKRTVLDLVYQGRTLVPVGHYLGTDVKLTGGLRSQAVDADGDGVVDMFLTFACTENDDGSMERTEIQYAGADDQGTPKKKSVSTYDRRGRLTRDLDHDWDAVAGAWQFDDCEQYDMTRDETSGLLMEESQRWTGSEASWNEGTKFVYTAHDEQGNPTLAEVYVWDRATQKWLDASIRTVSYTYTYDDMGRMTLLTKHNGVAPAADNTMVREIRGYSETGALVHYERWGNDGTLFREVGYRCTLDAAGRISAITVMKGGSEYVISVNWVKRSDLPRPAYDFLTQPGFDGVLAYMGISLVYYHREQLH